MLEISKNPRENGNGRPQQISAMNYIKNNKRRVSVLIVSLTLFVVMVYVSQFLLSSTEETFRPVMLENTKKMQFLSIAGSSFGLDTTQDSDVLMEQYEEKVEELKSRLLLESSISEVYYSQVIYTYVKPAIGQIATECPLLTQEELPEILEHMGGKLSKGRMPEKEGEMLLDHASMLNNGYQVGDYFRQDTYAEKYVIVGEIECDFYFGCGIAREEDNLNKMLIVLSDGGIQDFTELLIGYGINIRENFDEIVDQKIATRWFQEEVIEQLNASTKYIYPSIIVVLFISIFVVYITYLRDRHDEWCLYSSIGYSKKTIYFSIMRELMFTFGFALFAGGILTSIMVVLLDYGMIQTLGLRCKYLYSNTIGEILCVFVLLLGLLQIPIQYALMKIKTIDAMEEL